MLVNATAWCFLGLLGLLVSGCSSSRLARADGEAGAPAADDGGPAEIASCSAFTPCGGVLFGRWRLKSTCIGAARASYPECADYVSTQSVSGDASFEFGSDGSLKYAGSATLTFDTAVTDACARALVGQDAAAYCKLVASGASTDGTVPVSATCSASNGLCQCHLVEGPIASAPDDTYETSGNNVTITTDGVRRVRPYCVVGDELTLGDSPNVPAVRFARQ